MDALSLLAVLGFAVALAFLARLTGRYHRGPFAYLVGRMATDIAPHCAAIARMLYGAAAVLVATALATFLWPQQTSAITGWSPIALIFVAALAAAIPAQLSRSRR